MSAEPAPGVEPKLSAGTGIGLNAHGRFIYDPRLNANVSVAQQMITPLRNNLEVHDRFGQKLVYLRVTRGSAPRVCELILLGSVDDLREALRGH